MSIDDFKAQMNEWGRQRVPFLFVIDFEMQKPWIKRIDTIDADKIMFSINGVTNSSIKNGAHDHLFISEVHPIPFETYQRKFDYVYDRLAYGDSFLINLTVKSNIVLSAPLKTIFHNSVAKYKLLFDEEFLCFSPETFVQIRDGRIFSYPMKGTIDAAISNASAIILADKKELAEHVTIVDLIRNDLSLVATGVEVTRFRFVDEIATQDKTLLQVSSEITGNLPDDYLNALGDIMVSLLPAGSISGAPKVKTTEIIAQAEGEPRGYYSGIVGYFDGRNLDSGVMIRYIEKANELYFYRSGAGITTQSKAETEYQETIDKVYVPLA